MLYLRTNPQINDHTQIIGLGLLLKTHQIGWNLHSRPLLIRTKLLLPTINLPVSKQCLVATSSHSSSIVTQSSIFLALRSHPFRRRRCSRHSVHSSLVALGILVLRLHSQIVCQALEIIVLVLGALILELHGVLCVIIVVELDIEGCQVFWI